MEKLIFVFTQWVEKILVAQACVSLHVVSQESVVAHGPLVFDLRGKVSFLFYIYSEMYSKRFN